MAFYDLALGVTQHYVYRAVLVTTPPRSNPRDPTYQWKNVKESGDHNFKTTRDSFQPTKMLKQNNWLA